MLQAAEQDLALARRARGLPFGASIGPMRLGNLSGITRTSTFGAELDVALGASRSDEYFGGLVTDKIAALDAVKQLPQRLVRELQSYAAAAAASLKSMPPGSAFGDRIHESVRNLADEISRNLELPPGAAAELRNAMMTAPASLQRFIQSQSFANRLEAAQLGLPEQLPQTGDELIRRIPRGDRARIQMLIDERRSHQENLVARYNQINLAGQPDEIELRATAAEIAQNRDALMLLERQVDDTGRAFAEFATNSRSAIEDGLGGALFNIISQTGDVGDAFRAMAASILREWTNLQAKLIVQGLFGDLGQTQSDGSIGAGGGILGGLISGAASGFGNFFSGLFGGSRINQYGGVGNLPYGPPAPGRAAGGPVFAGHDYIVGEAGAERFRPRVNGDIIPSHMTGAGVVPLPMQDLSLRREKEDRPQVNIFFVRDEDEAWQKSYRANRDILIKDLGRDHRVRDMMYHYGR